jgi:hypothetical protein
VTPRLFDGAEFPFNIVLPAGPCGPGDFIITLFYNSVNITFSVDIIYLTIS